jgi:hypothetical protein
MTMPFRHGLFQYKAALIKVIIENSCLSFSKFLLSLISSLTTMSPMKSLSDPDWLQKIIHGTAGTCLSGSNGKIAIREACNLFCISYDY